MFSPRLHALPAAFRTFGEKGVAGVVAGARRKGGTDFASRGPIVPAYTGGHPIPASKLLAVIATDETRGTHAKWSETDRFGTIYPSWKL